MRAGPRLRKSNSAPSLLSMVCEGFSVEPTLCGEDAGCAVSTGGRQPWHLDQDQPPPGCARQGLRCCARPRQARRACLLAGHQTARAGARKGRGRDPRPRRRLGSVGLDVKASLGRAGVCDWPAHRARALSALGLCGQGRTRKSAFCGEGTSASLADGGGRTGTWTAWSSSRIPSSSRRKNTSARWPCAMSSVSIRSEPHARADARRRPARAKDRVVQACEFHTTQALRSADSC